MTKSITDIFLEYGVCLTKKEGMYRCESISNELALQETDKSIKLIYKGESIKTYPATLDTYEHLATMFYESVFDFNEYDEYGESYITINDWCYTWNARTPFNNGPLYVMDTIGYMDRDKRGEDVSYDQPLNINEVLTVIFSRHKEQDFIVPHYFEQNFVILNPYQFPNSNFSLNNI